MSKVKIVIDTNVIVSALKSNKGFSYKLLSIIDDNRLEICISVPVLLEYKEVIKRYRTKIKLTVRDIEDILDYICSIAKERKVFYLWRPLLKDPKDDMFLELAVESECDFIITFNEKDFIGAEKFGIKVKTPKELLKIIGEIK